MTPAEKLVADLDEFDRQHQEMIAGLEASLGAILAQVRTPRVREAVESKFAGERARIDALHAETVEARLTLFEIEHGMTTETLQ